MSLVPYETMKEISNSFLRRVPEHWTVAKAKRFFTVRSGEMISSQEEKTEGTPIVGGNGIRGYTTKSNTPGDTVVIGRVGAQCGCVHHIQEQFWASEHAFCVEKKQVSCNRFLYYLLTAVNLNQFAIKTAQPLLNTTIVEVQELTFPPLSEQRSIAAFLDAETSKIDALVAEQRRLIELLKEKRQAVISHAVTKGLNPHVKMKPSGIDWLGDVPEHWELSRGRYLYRERNEIPEPDDGVVTSFRDGQVTLRTNRRTEGFTFAILELGYQRVREGDLVIHGMDAFAGAIGVSESTGKCTPEYSVLIPNSAATDNRYYSYLVRLMALRNYVYVICPSVRERAPRFRFSSFKNVLLPSPPHEEQLAIVNEIEMVTTQTSNLISESELVIALLQERRTALISAAVTGKIDVRGFVPKEASA